MDKELKVTKDPNLENEVVEKPAITEEGKSALTKFNKFETVEEQLQYAEHLIKSKLINFAKPEHAVMAFNVGRSLGVDASISAMHMYPIDGKITLSVHLATALARRLGVDWEIIKDGVKEKIGENAQKQPIYDMITQIKFYRKNEVLNKVMENTMTYTWKDAKNAQLDTKDNWKKRPRNMLRSRCLMEGIRFVASDALMGVFYESTEIAEGSQKTVDIDDEGNIII